MLLRKETDAHRNKHLVVLILFFTGLFILTDSGLAKSFPFRALSVGKPVPEAKFIGYKGEEAKTIHSFAGKPLLLAFWGGADMEAKKKRAVNTIKAVQELEPYLKKKGVSVLVVNMQNDQQNVVDEVSALAGLTMPVYKDASQEAYASFGVYVLPSFLLIDKDGNVSGGSGYSKDIAQRLRGEVDVMLGLMTPEELEAELNPVMKVVPKEEKLALRHMQMGTVMKNKGMPDAAIREYMTALELNPVLHEARVGLGCLYLEKGALDDAIKELEAGLAGDPDSLEAEICLARVSAEMGEVDEAVLDLKNLLFRNSRNYDLHYFLGTFLERQGKYEESAQSYRKAFDLLQRKTLIHE
ncbi:MAG: redoxin family protein [Proteobacteria bacterium]|nr:redoxin family protein [Pseudomonadota bacterium]MBU1060428.1 redoxin family protein [Pseudomonadota bacterium]